MSSKIGGSGVANSEVHIKEGEKVTTFEKGAELLFSTTNPLRGGKKNKRMSIRAERDQIELERGRGRRNSLPKKENSSGRKSQKSGDDE